MRAATGCGCDTYTGWLPLTSTTLEPARLDIHRWASGGIILSSVVTKYQLGFVFHAGSADRSVECLNAPRDLGIRHKSSRVWCHVSGEGSGKLRVIEEQISILWRQNRWHRSTGRRVLLSAWTPTRLRRERMQPHRPTRQLSGHCLPP